MPNTPLPSTTSRKQNYLNNKDLMAEIHLSKMSFSSYVTKDHAFFDLIVRDLSEINEGTITEAKRLRAKKIGMAAFNTAKQNGKKVKIADVTPSIDEIPTVDLVFRVMTFDHIPLCPGRKKKIVTTADAHERVNFPPYQHWKYDETNNLICVGKSHWEGDLDTGHFSKSHGRITENLGRMFIKLCERYSQRSNWRGYTYVDEMRSQSILQLSAVGLQFDESKSDNPFSYFTAILGNAFTRVLNSEKKMQNIRDDLLEENGLTPSLTRQNKHEFASEVARQAEIYKNTRLPKSEQSDDLIDEDDIFFVPTIKRKLPLPRK